MTCPKCGAKTGVINSVSDVDAIYRERKCKGCGYAFFTIEVESDDYYTLGKLKYQQRLKRKGKK